MRVVQGMVDHQSQVHHQLEQEEQVIVFYYQSKIAGRFFYNFLTFSTNIDVCRQFIIKYKWQINIHVVKDTVVKNMNSSINSMSQSKKSFFYDYKVQRINILL